MQKQLSNAYGKGWFGLKWAVKETNVDFWNGKRSVVSSVIVYWRFVDQRAIIPTAATVFCLCKRVVFVHTGVQTQNCSTTHDTTQGEVYM